MDVIRGYRYRLYPDAEQAEALSRTVGVVRLVYNLALEQRRIFGTRRYGGHRHSLGAKNLSQDLSQLRREIDWIGAISQTAQNQALIDLDRAFANFFQGRAGYPTPRRKYRDDSFRHTGREIEVRQLNTKWSEVKIPKIGWIRFRDTRPLGGVIRNATLRRSAGGAWEVSIACRVTLDAPQVRNGAEGIDRGVVIPFASSTGEMTYLPGTVTRRQRSIRRAARDLSRRQRGSKRYAKARRRIARLKARDARARAHVAHEASTKIARRSGLVAIENLKISSMTRSARGTPDAPGVNVRQKAGLNRAILNVGWHRFETMLAYKLEAAGGVLVKVASHYTSQTCACCGTRHPDSRKSQALFVCEDCGATHNADINAARNILALAGGPPG